MSDGFLKFEEWEKSIPAFYKRDPLWESLYYRVALYLYDLVWDDCDLLQKHSLARHNVAQIMRSSGSVSANMEEAYGRGVGTPDYRCRHAFPADLIEHRYKVIDHLISLIINLLKSHKQNLGKK